MIADSHLNYKIVETIGKGSFGQVYLVKDDNNRFYALKKITVNPFEVEQSQKQIEVMKQLIHPNMVKILNSSFDQERSQLSILMEYCQDGDLLTYLLNRKKQKKPFSAQQILRIYKQISVAFIVMNVKGVFHRDLKPQNILIGKGMVIKVADFGCARSTDSVDISKCQNYTLEKGTAIYASPQLLANEKYSFKCDVWAAGCMLYLIYYGQHPFFLTKAHDALEYIKERTQGKEIQLKNNTDPTIAKILTLTLAYQDKDRASWRELWLSRVFADKIEDVAGFIDYLKNVAIIANWMTKQFWKIRKQFAIGQFKDQLFVYFIIKFQFDAFKLALNIFKKSDKVRYLFEESKFRQYQPNEAQFNDIKKNYLQHQKYFASIKKSMQNKQAYRAILEKEPQRVSAFSDLDISIRSAYKILRDVKDKLQQGPSKAQNKIWIAMARWINFQKYFGFEKEPRVEKIISEPIVDLRNQVKEELQRYQTGIVF